MYQVEFAVGMHFVQIWEYFLSVMSEICMIVLNIGNLSLKRYYRP